jgi:midasin
MCSLSGNTALGSWPTIGQVLLLLEQTKNSHFSLAIRQYLRPALNRLFHSAKCGRCSPIDLGPCWIAFSWLIIELYVPDIPIDPAAMQLCLVQLLRQEEAALLAQRQLHSRYEECNSGNSNSMILRYIDARLREISSSLLQTSTLTVHERPEGPSRLHTYWSEVSQFQAQILSSQKIDSLLLSLCNRDAAAIIREQVFQESISGFAQRLITMYPEYEDVSFPIQLALQSVKLGLRLVVNQTCFNPDVAPVARLAVALVSFPSIRSCDMLCKESPIIGPSGMTAFSHLLLNLAAVACQQSISVNGLTTGVDTIYEQVLRLWLIDRARDDETEQASQSLYRRQAMDYDPAGDAEEEEREFLALFPTFEDALDQEGPQPQKSSHPVLVDSSLVKQLVDIHKILQDQQDPRIDASALFYDIRKRSLECLLPAHLSELPDTLDVESHLFQIFLLQDRLASLGSTPKERNTFYNFYNDANILETRKASVILEALVTRLESLIQEWPDQVVLQHMKNRCDLVLQLDLRSPVAKVLTGLEQVLVQSEDWEIYANRENSLKAHQQAITGLIIEWRRLELACWQGLLQSQAKLFADETAEWWFRLYNAVVRGPLDASDEDSEDITTAYLGSLIPLLDEFIRSSPLGQYHSRMQLLHSFVTYVDRLAGNYVDGKRIILERVRRVLQITAQYYESFSAQLSALLSEQQTSLEKELRAFIKLASWKDVNVLALKQSARRTHHQLYKIIRKFRNVLRQPISDQFRPEQAGQAECKYLPLTILANTQLHNSWDSDLPVSHSVLPIPTHLFHLNATFKKFDLLISSHIRSFIASCTADPVDHLAVNIISTAQALANENVLGSVAPRNREKHQKALLVRKRKALSDLLKELKRGGLAVNVKPDVLRQQREMLWIREQPTFSASSQEHFLVGKGESYFLRLLSSLPELRESLSNHHSDLTTRELQRGIMFVESGFAMAMEMRAWYAPIPF